MTDVTIILGRIEDGDPSAAEKLLPLVYRELRKLAAARMTNERPEHTLQATALVHEAYLRLVDVDKAQNWNSRGHFFAAAAEAMRRILVDQARQKQSAKQGGHLHRQQFFESALHTADSTIDLLTLNDALTKLSSQNPRKAQLVELRFFAGFTIEEAAQILGISMTTAVEDWSYAKSWLKVELADKEQSSVS
jgi:RNA polymerase sigma factor (TIGR02999 family)